MSYPAPGWLAGLERDLHLPSSSTGTFSITANVDGTTITVP